jgi:hypothetical protein
MMCSELYYLIETKLKTLSVQWIYSLL